MAIGLRNKARPRWRRIALALAVALAGGLTVAVPSGTASAVNQTCLNYPGSSYTLRFDNPYVVQEYDPLMGQWVTRTKRFFFPDGHDHAHVVLTFWIHSVTPTFNPGPGAFVDNRTDQTITGTFSTMQTRTFSITETQTTGVSTTFLGTTFSATVSTSVTSAISTSTSITASGPVPPHSRVNGTLGVDAYIVNYDVDFWQWDQNTCWYHGAHRNVTANVPTTTQGWRLEPAQPI